jgi:hypothetical protein
MTAACTAAALATAALAGPAPAQERPTNSDQELGIILSQPLGSTGPDAVNRPRAGRRPLMSALDRVGVGGAFDRARLEVFGHVEGSYTRNADNPELGFNVGRVFDFEDDEPTLNQVDLNLLRAVGPDRPGNAGSDAFDVGGRLELLWGADARFIHANGMFDHTDPDGTGTDTNDITDGPENQFDIPQAYVDVNVPIGNGLRVRGGKFLFFKQIDPNASVFYSHSFTFGAALPFTLTGGTLYYEFTDALSLEGGIVRGWDDALEDDNGAVSGVGRLRWRASDELNFSLAAISGPELEDDNHNYRTAVNFVASYRPTDRWTFLLDSIYGYQSAAPGEGASDWYGAAVYGIYKVNDFVSAAARVEYYRDDEGFTTGIATAGPAFGFSSQSLYEATVGVTVTPFANDELGRNFKVRPEVRYDYSSEDFFDGFTEDDQLTFAVDAIFNY